MSGQGVDEAPIDGDAAEETLAREYHRTGRWYELISLRCTQAAAASRPGHKVRFLAEAARLHVDKFSNNGEAVRQFEAVIELEPGHAEARAFLEHHYERRRDRKKLALLRGGPGVPRVGPPPEAPRPGPAVIVSAPDHERLIYRRGRAGWALHALETLAWIGVVGMCGVFAVALLPLAPEALRKAIALGSWFFVIPAILFGLVMLSLWGLLAVAFGRFAFASARDLFSRRCVTKEGQIQRREIEIIRSSRSTRRRRIVVIDYQSRTMPRRVYDQLEVGMRVRLELSPRTEHLLAVTILGR